MIDIDREPLMSLEQAAKRCGVSIRTIRNYVDGRKPRLETLRAGKQIRTTASAVNSWLAACKRAMGGNETRAIRREANLNDNTDEVELLRAAHGI